MFLERMNYLDVEAYLKEHDTVIIPVGSLENHGRHMPLGTDTLIPDRIAHLADKLSGAVFAPTLPYGSTEDIRGFAGTVSLGNTLLRQLLSCICGQLFDMGFRHFIILNGHGGNNAAINEVGQEMYRKGAILACVNWWLIAGQLNPEWKGGHGGGEETAAIMGIDESLIHYEYIGDGEEARNDLGDELPGNGWTGVTFRGASVTVPRPIHAITDNGWLTHGMGFDPPTKATAAWGKEMLDTMADYTAAFAETFSRVKLPEKEK